MKKLMKIPYYIPFLGIMASFGIFIYIANSPNTALLIAGLILFHLSAWVFAARFFVSVLGAFGSILSGK